MTREKILMIIPNLGFGGAQRVFHNVSIALAERYIVIECVFNFDNGHAYPSGNEIYSLNVPAGKNFAHKLYCFVLRTYRLKKLKQKLKIDYTISHLEGADYCNLLSAGNGKVILCIHGSKIYDKAIRGILGLFRKKVFIPLLYKRADEIVVVAKGIADELTDIFRIPNEKITVINNGLDLTHIENLASDTQLADNYPFIFRKPVLITHGRIAVEKNQKLLIDTYARKLAQGQTNLVIIGEGPLLDMLVSYARSLGLSVFNSKEIQAINESHSVFFLGYLSNPFSFLKKSDIFLFPSIFEGLPLALVEAMACGLPVIARDCPYGPKEILVTSYQGNTEYGILISGNLQEEQELDAWGTAINQLLSSPTQAQNLHQKSIERSAAYGMPVFAANWLNVIKKLSPAANLDL